MGYTLVNKGAEIDGSSGTLVVPMPSGWAAGNLGLIRADGRNNADTITTPSGWQLLSPNSIVTWSAIFGRILQAGDTAPSVVWSGAHQDVAQMSAWSGTVWPDITTIVAASVEKSGTNNDIVYDALTVPVDNCLCISAGSHNKTSASNTASIDALTGATQIDQQVIAGTAIMAYWGYVQQTSKANLTTHTQTITNSAESLQYSTIILALKSATTVVVPPIIANFRLHME
jgi:hypothetical protein